MVFANQPTDGQKLHSSNSFCYSLKIQKAGFSGLFCCFAKLEVFSMGRVEFVCFYHSYGCVIIGVFYNGGDGECGLAW